MLMLRRGEAYTVNLLGYAWMSTGQQDQRLQLDALSDAGREFVFRDKVSGVQGHRHTLYKCTAPLEPDHTLVV